MYCPIIKEECIKEKCSFWHSLWNPGTKKTDYNCIKIWEVDLKIELIQAINKIVDIKPK